MFYAKVCINTCYFLLFFLEASERSKLWCIEAKANWVQERTQRYGAGFCVHRSTKSTCKGLAYTLERRTFVTERHTKVYWFQKKFQFFCFFPQVSSKAPEFMSPNVWRKPQEQRPSSAKLNHDSDSEDDCQIIGEEPRKSKSTSMHNMFLAMFLLF